MVNCYVNADNLQTISLMDGDASEVLLCVPKATVSIESRFYFRHRLAAVVGQTARRDGEGASVFLDARRGRDVLYRREHAHDLDGRGRQDALTLRLKRYAEQFVLRLGRLFWSDSRTRVFLGSGANPVAPRMFGFVHRTVCVHSECLGSL